MRGYGAIAIHKDATEVPSANSTDLPIRDRRVGKQPSDETNSLLPDGNNANGSFSSDNRPFPLKWKLSILALVLLVAGACLWFFRHPNEIHFPRDNTKNDSTSTLSITTTNAFSKLDPVHDLGLTSFSRPDAPSPLTRGRPNATAYPTNAWYQNMLMAADEPGDSNRAYTIPYIVDAVGPISGLRVHPNHADASSFVVQLNVISQFALTIGAAHNTTISSSGRNSSNITRSYKATHTTQLGVTLEWDSFPMHSSITKGMPYATMLYHSFSSTTSTNMLPTVASEVPLGKNPKVDGGKEVHCHSSGAKPFLVERDVELYFTESDFTWLVFVSEPVLMHCVLDELGMMHLQVVEWANEPIQTRDLVLRIALLTVCTTGRDPVWCHQEKMHPTALLLGQGHYGELLRLHADMFPGPDSSFDYSFDDNESNAMATLIFDWDAQDMSEIAMYPVPSNQTREVLAFALPHHFDIIVQAPPSDHDIYCVSTLIGPACLYEGSVWQLREEIPSIGFRASQPPYPWSIPAIASSLQDDLNYTLPDYYQRGAGDTYFSGKMLARLARILLIAEELDELCSKSRGEDEYTSACNKATLPSKEKFQGALDRLRSSVEIWVNGTAETPFVYDPVWGGVVSCGCDFDGEKSICKNKFPNCPAFGDPGLDFGNAFYNDVHFHYGYFIHAAAVLSHLDPAWGRSMFERILLFIRVIASPDGEDYFTPWRHKDWFNGHSWASGIAVSVLNGKNQESSSESIAAYEAVALYGSAMVAAWKETEDTRSLESAQAVERVGQLLAATELRSARRYWHVLNGDNNDIKIFPKLYTPHTVGIMWQTMAQCQTWFGAAQFLAYGIQLLPLTPIAEHRDTIPWSKGMYHSFAKSCREDLGCEQNGWSILKLAQLARVGHQELSADLIQKLPPEVFDSAGGNGHSLSNTLWFAATRENVERPLAMTKAEIKAAAAAQHAIEQNTTASSIHVLDCGVPDRCTDFVLDTIAGLYSCRQRMDWLMQQMGQTEAEACAQIAGVENRHECGRCDPAATESDEKDEEETKCPDCTEEQCQSDINRCPKYKSTFVCSKGINLGGCSSSPWIVPSQQCKECCELTHCPVLDPAVLRAKNEANCPPCDREICHGTVNRCPSHLGKQYLCIEGPSTGGCSLIPWSIEVEQCKTCCSVMPGCDK